jgi:hypothetical protein
MRRYLSEKHRLAAHHDQREWELLQELKATPDVSRKKELHRELGKVHAAQEKVEAASSDSLCSSCSCEINHTNVVCVPIADGVAINRGERPTLFKDFPPGESPSLFLCHRCAITMGITTPEEVE